MSVLPGMGGGFMLGGGGLRIAVLVDVEGLTAIPAGTKYVSIFAVDGGNGGSDGGSSGGAGGNGGYCRINLNLSVTGHTGVYVIPGEGGGGVRADTGEGTWVGWENDVVITPTINRAGGTRGSGSSTRGGGGGGPGGPAGIGGHGGDAGSTGGAGGAAGEVGSIVEFIPRSGKGGTGGSGTSTPWGGGGAGGSEGTSGRVGASGGCLLLFTSELVTI